MRGRLQTGQDARGAEEERAGADGKDDFFVPFACPFPVSGSLVMGWGGVLVEGLDEFHFLGSGFDHVEQQGRPAARDDEDVEVADFGQRGGDAHVCFYGHAVAGEDLGAAVRGGEDVSGFGAG